MQTGPVAKHKEAEANYVDCRNSGILILVARFFSKFSYQTSQQNYSRPTAPLSHTSPARRQVTLWIAYSATSSVTRRDIQLNYSRPTAPLSHTSPARRQVTLWIAYSAHVMLNGSSILSFITH